MLISLLQPHDLCHIRVKLKSLCLQCFDIRVVQFIEAKVISCMKIIILPEIVAVNQFLDKGKRMLKT